MKEFLKGLIFYFINHILNKIPSRRVRMLFYHYLSNKRISRKATIGLGVRILDIRGVEIGDFTNVNFESILDGRGEGIFIDKNVDIAPQVNIWSLGHDPKSPEHEAKSGKVFIEEGCWLANRSIILPGVRLGQNVVVGAGSIVHGKYDSNKMLLGQKAKMVSKTFSTKRTQIKPIRFFR